MPGGGAGSRPGFLGANLGHSSLRTLRTFPESLPPCHSEEQRDEESAVSPALRKKQISHREKGKIVLPCRLRFRPKDRWCCPVLCGAGWVFAPATAST